MAVGAVVGPVRASFRQNFLGIGLWILRGLDTARRCQAPRRPGGELLDPSWLRLGTEAARCDFQEGEAANADYKDCGDEKC